MYHNPVQFHNVKYELSSIITTYQWIKPISSSVFRYQALLIWNNVTMFYLTVKIRDSDRISSLSYSAEKKQCLQMFEWMNEWMPLTRSIQIKNI